MALKRYCDGCGEPEGSTPLKLVGTIVPREYCPACTARALEYMGHRNKAHERAVEKWLEKHNAILEQFIDLKVLPDA